MKKNWMNSTAATIGFAVLSISFTLQATAQIVDVHSFTEVNASVPDGNASGFSDVRIINSAVAELSSLRVRLQIDGEFNGDLYGYVRHIGGGVTNIAILLNRPGRTTANTTGYADRGMDVWFDDSGPNGDIHVYQEVAPPAFGSPVIGIWQPDGRKVDPDQVIVTSPRTVLLDNFTGISASGEWTLFLADMESGGTNMLVGWELEFVGREAPVVSWPPPSPIVYGTALTNTELNASSPVTGVFTYSPPLGAMLNAGSGQQLSAIFNPTDTTGYLTVTQQVSIDVVKKNLTVIANSYGKVYGEPLPSSFGVTYSGFVSGEDSSVLTSTATATTAAGTLSPAGSYPISASGAVGDNYDIGYVDGILSISKASLAAVIASSTNPSLPGGDVTFTATLTPAAPATGIPTGTGQFQDNGSPLGSTSVLVVGAATETASSLTHGLHSIYFDYGGDENFHGVTASLVTDQIVNTPPEAMTDDIERYPLEGTKVLISEILVNDTDADGDTITFLIADTPSMLGGTVSRNGDWIHYDAPVGNTNADSFTYTITDSFGSEASATVNVKIKSDQVPSPNLTIESLADDALRIRFDGIPGRTYRVQFSDEVYPAFWQQLATGTADGVGLFIFTNTPPTGEQHRYYRTAYP